MLTNAIRVFWVYLTIYESHLSLFTLRVFFFFFLIERCCYSNSNSRCRQQYQQHRIASFNKPNISCIVSRRIWNKITIFFVCMGIWVKVYSVQCTVGNAKVQHVDAVCICVVFGAGTTLVILSFANKSVVTEQCIGLVTFYLNSFFCFVFHCFVSFQIAKLISFVLR